jgi:cell wall-associated NlpC family hydrolase
VAEENNIGASRLLGTNGLQQAVDSLTTQVNKMSADVGKLVSSIDGLTGTTKRSTGTSSSASGWNAGSNSNRYSSNGGGGSFSGTGRQGGNRSNGGGGGFGALGAGSRLSAGVGAAMGVASALTQYGNKNMSNMMQMNFYGSQSALAGGGTTGNNVAMRMAFANNYAALNTTDAAQAAYINQYTFGNAVFNGQSNPAFASGQAQANSFGYLSPTMGAAASATAAQQTFSARSRIMGQAYGLGSLNRNASMSSIAQGMMQRTFGNQKLTAAQFNAAIQQGGSLNVNMQSWGSQMGWSQNTIQEYQNYLQGQVTAQNKGISSAQYSTLTQQAANGNKSAISKLKSVGIGTSAFEAQRNLNSTQMTRQEDVNETMASAFTKTTDVVNQFSQAMTAMMKATGLDKLLGIGAGTASPISNALGGFSGAFGAGAGLLGASRLLGGSGGLLGALFGRGASAASGLGSVGADGAFNITTVAGGAASTGLLARMLPAAGALGAAGLAGQTTQNTMNNIANKGGKDTSAFEKAMINHLGDSKAKQAAAAKAWFAAHPGASVDPKILQLEGGGYSPSSAPGGYGQASSSSIMDGGSSVGNGSSSGSGANAASVIRAAETQIGTPYVWGGETPGKAMDCSGLTQWAYGQAGVKIPRVAADQQKSAKAVDKNKTQAGDLLFVGNPAHHVVMSVGGGKIIEAPHPGATVRIRTLNPGEFDTAGRVVGSVGNLSSLTGNVSSNSTLSTSQSRSGGDIGMLGGTSEAAIVAAALAGGGGGAPVTSQASSTTASGVSSAGSPTGSTPTSNGNNSKSALQSYAKALLAKYGWGGQWGSFNALEMSEAGWDYKATNPTSGAYGLAQALPAGKYASAGSDWRTNGDTQLAWMMDYIKGRYGSPDSAWSFHQKNNWYAAGAWNIDKDQGATVHKGEMIIPAQQAETIRQTLINSTNNPNVAKNASSGGATISLGGVTVNLPSTFTGSYQDAQDIGKAVSKAVSDQLRLSTLQIGQ